MPATKRTRKRPARKQKLPSIKLEAGKFYRALDGTSWCCFKVELDKPVHCQAWCIQVEAAGERNRIEYFYLDGRYDEEGKREHTLIEEILPPHQQVVGEPWVIRDLLQARVEAIFHERLQVRLVRYD